MRHRSGIHDDITPRSADVRAFVASERPQAELDLDRSQFRAWRGGERDNPALGAGPSGSTATGSAIIWVMTRVLQCGRCDWTASVEGDTSATVELRRHARSCPAGPHPIGREYVFVEAEADNSLPIEPLVALVSELARAADLKTGTAKLRSAVEVLEPTTVHGSGLDVVDDLSYDLGFFSPDHAWEDPSLLTEEAARSMIVQALETLRQLSQ